MQSTLQPLPRRRSWRAPSFPVGGGTEAEDQAVSVGKVTEPALGGIFGLAPGGAAASDAGVVSFVVRYFNAYTGRLSSHYPVAHRARSAT